MSKNSRQKAGKKAETGKKASPIKKAPSSKKTSSIGTKKEGSLHRSLKFHYSGTGGDTEKAAGAYVCDAQTSEGELIEVQTGSFGPLKEKAKMLVKTGKLKIIYPVVIQKTIELFDVEGRLIRRRKSTRKGSEWDLFGALVYAPELPLLKNLSMELAVIDVTEKRIDDGSGSWRRKGVRISDRILGAWHYSIVLKSPKDFSRFIPFKKNERFTARLLTGKAGIPASLAQKALYVLTKMDLVERIGKQGNAIVYKRR